ncbi:parathyroid hormone 4 [Osmerus mordax]|uniref:parathyroid hormone 4 n=1 Tax=Osmerus mordax TaxID=8014 RepID=UPI00350F7493
MVLPLKPVQMLALMVLVVFTISQCQETESRRAVTEHQLMHDRGRTIQSLKRLIWLSSAMEGLHTAQTRSALYPPSFALSQGPVSGLAPFPARQDSGPSRGAMESLLRDFFNPHLSGLSEGEP